MFSILQAIILGSLQGILEWLPVSSEGVVTLVSLSFFGKEFEEALYFAIWLHLGTLMAAVVYFRSEIVQLLEVFWRMLKEKRARPEASGERILIFVVIATIVTGIVGTPLLIFASNLKLPPVYTTLAIGVLLIITGLLNYFRKESITNTNKPSVKEATGVGIFQSFSILPGLSRSGLTVFYLLVRGFEPKKSLKLSFLISIPAILGGNILLGILDKSPSFTWSGLVGGLFAFVFGIVTIKSLIKMANKVNFAYFCFILGSLAIIISLFTI